MIRRLAQRAAMRIMQRSPDFVIGEEYLHRWYVIPRNRWFNVYLHRYVGSDDDRALHDHPWWSLSWMLAGRLIEHDHAGRHAIEAGRWRLRPARYAHRLELASICAITLFITGPKIRTWGFHCPWGWRPWDKFVDPGNPGQPGPGCD